MLGLAPAVCLCLAVHKHKLAITFVRLDALLTFELFYAHTLC